MRGCMCPLCCTQRWVFPCYSWVAENTSRLYFTGMPASVPSRTPWWLVKQREKALDKVRLLGDVKSSLGGAKSSLGGAESSRGDAKSSRWVTLRALAGCLE